jgi:hypothetical protein
MVLLEAQPILTAYRAGLLLTLRRTHYETQLIKGLFGQAVALRVGALL